jgi:cytoskeletal protein CcmA (bactofilin family)
MRGKRRGNAPTIIGNGSTIEGTLRVEHGLHVEGTVEGDVVAEGEVSVGPEGVIRGTVTADALAVAGSLEGTAHVHGPLHMLPTGRLKGDAYYETLQVETGGVVEGRTERVAPGQGRADAAQRGGSATPADRPNPSPSKEGPKPSAGDRTAASTTGPASRPAPSTPPAGATGSRKSSSALGAKA